MFRPNTGNLQVSSWKAVRKICYTIMQTRKFYEQLSKMKPEDGQC